MSQNHSVGYHQDGVALDNVVVSNHDVLLSVHEGVALEVENSEILVVQVNVRPALGGAGNLQFADPAIAQLLQCSGHCSSHFVHAHGKFLPNNLSVLQRSVSAIATSFSTVGTFTPRS